MARFLAAVAFVLVAAVALAGDTPAEVSVRLSNKVLIDKPPRQNFIPEYLAKADLLKMEIPEGTVICNACFGQEVVDSEVFPAGMTGVTFLDCNLDNCVVPEGNKVINSQGKTVTPKRFTLREFVDGKGEKVYVPWLLQAGSKTDLAETSIDGKTSAEVAK